MYHRGMREIPQLPNENHRAVPEAEISRLLSEQFADFDGLIEVRYLGSGEDNDAYEVNGDLIFRFSKNSKASEKMASEIRILPILARHTTAPIPHIEYAGMQEDGRYFMGYRKLPGEKLTRVDFEQLSDTEKRSFFDTLADAIRGTFAIPDVETRAAGIPELNLQGRLQRYYSRWQNTPAAVEALTETQRQKVSEVMRMLQEVPLNAACLVNTDLSADHVLFDPATRTVTGIIDWSDLVMTDPDFVFHRILQTYGDEPLRAIVTRARPEADIARIRAYALVRSLAQMADAYARSHPDIHERLEKVRYILGLLDN
jgi:aminoglycoside 2''-phosphotransferase